MLKEFVDQIAKLAVDAQAPKILKTDAEPKHVYYLLNPGEPAKKCEAEPPPREHRAGNLETIVAFAERFKDDPGVVVWYSCDGIKAIIGDDTRRDTVYLDLNVSPQFKRVKDLDDNRVAFSQAEFRRLLKITFADCLERCPNLAGLIERVKFRTSSQTDANIGHGKSSIGKQLEAQVTATAELPEYVELAVPIFAKVFPFRATIRCALEPDPVKETFVLTPLPGEVDRAIGLAEDGIAERLCADLGDAMIYRGEP